MGYAITTYSKETNLPVIGFDMGGKNEYYEIPAGQEVNSSIFTMIIHIGKDMLLFMLDHTKKLLSVH